MTLSQGRSPCLLISTPFRVPKDTFGLAFLMCLRKMKLLQAFSDGRGPKLLSLELLQAPGVHPCSQGGKRSPVPVHRYVSFFFPGYKETLQAPAEVHQRNKQIQNKQT